MILRWASFSFAEFNPDSLMKHGEGEVVNMGFRLPGKIEEDSHVVFQPQMSKGNLLEPENQCCFTLIHLGFKSAFVIFPGTNGSWPRNSSHDLCAVHFPSTQGKLGTIGRTCDCHSDKEWCRLGSIDPVTAWLAIPSKC